MTSQLLFAGDSAEIASLCVMHEVSRGLWPAHVFVFQSSEEYTRCSNGNAGIPHVEDFAPEVVEQVLVWFVCEILY